MPSQFGRRMARCSITSRFAMGAFLPVGPADRSGDQASDGGRLVPSSTCTTPVSVRQTGAAATNDIQAGYFYFTATEATGNIWMP